MKKGWEIKKLGEVCDIINGGTPKTNIDEYWNGNINWITPKDMGKLTSKYVYETERNITELGLKKSSAKLIPKNSIILSSRAPIGHLAINKVEISTNQGCKGIIPLNINEHYIYYFLLNSVEYLDSLGSGTTFKELSNTKLSEVLIPIPPIEEQKEIVERLDKGFELIDSLKETAKKNLDNSKELFQSVLREELSPKDGWETKTLGEVCDFVRGLTYSKNDEVNYSNNAVLRSNNIDPISLKLNLNEIKYINDSIQIAQDKIVQEGTIMICTANGSKSHLGKVAYIDKNYGYAFGGFMGLLKPKESVIPIYLYYSLITPIYKDYISKLSDGVNINNLKFSDLSIYSIPTPPIQEQEEIVGRLDRIKGYCEELEGNYKRVLELCEELKQGLLREAFSY